MKRKIPSISRAAAMFLGALLISFPAAEAIADGTEELGPPGIFIAAGTDFVAAGVGMRDTQPATLDITVPAGAVIRQVLLYWEGHMTNNVPGDNTILVNGTAVTGTLIGGQTFWFTGAYSSSFRADITGLGLIAPGANSLSLDGMVFDYLSDGAGIVVIFSDGPDAGALEIRDGVDLAYQPFPEPRKSTIPQTFNFTPAGVARTAHLALLVGSATTNSPRRSSIEITVDGSTTVISDALVCSDGYEWDTLHIDVDVPAGAGSCTVEIISRDDTGGGQQPVSIAWTCAAFSIPSAAPPPPPGDGPGRNECGSFLVFPLIDNINYTTVVELANIANDDVWLEGIMVVHPPGQPADFEKRDFHIHLTHQEPFWWDTSRAYFRRNVDDVLTSIPDFDNRKGFMFVWAIDNNASRLEIDWNHIIGDAVLYGGGRGFQYNAITHRALQVTGDRVLNLDDVEYTMGYSQNMVEGFAEGVIPGLEGTWVVCSPEIDFIGSIQPEFAIGLAVWNQDEVPQSRDLDFYQFRQYELGADLDLDIGSIFTPKWEYATTCSSPIWSIFYQTIGSQAWCQNVWYHPSTGVPAAVILAPVPP